MKTDLSKKTNSELLDGISLAFDYKLLGKLTPKLVKDSRAICREVIRRLSTPVPPIK